MPSPLVHWGTKCFAFLHYELFCGWKIIESIAKPDLSFYNSWNSIVNTVHFCSGDSVAYRRVRVMKLIVVTVTVTVESESESVSVSAWWKSALKQQRRPEKKKKTNSANETVKRIICQIVARCEDVSNLSLHKPQIFSTDKKSKTFFCPKIYQLWIFNRELKDVIWKRSIFVSRKEKLFVEEE